MPPDFRDSDSPGNVSLVLSQSTSLVCDVTGSPTPVITWYKDGTPVSINLIRFSFIVYAFFFNPEQIMLLVKPEGLDQEHDALIKINCVYTAAEEALCSDWIRKDYMNESNKKNLMTCLSFMQ